MKKEPLVSVIIPTYNRAHLIGETLDSVLAQIYQNWECIIVDDGSSDDTDEVVGEYVQKDSRFKYFHRPDEHLPGGNGARNYGLMHANGEYIVFFDSDDLMTENHLLIKYNLINSGNYDFAITRTKFFNHPIESNEKNDKFYVFDKYEINLDNYLLQRINWLSPDIIMKKEITSNLYFDESLKCAQEYNFFSRLLCVTNKSIYNTIYLTLRRFDPKSISETKRKKSNCKLISHWKTFNQTKHKANNFSKRILINSIYKTVITIDDRPKEISYLQLMYNIFRYGHNKVYKLIYLHVARYTNRFHFLRKLAFDE